MSEIFLMELAEQPAPYVVERLAKSIAAIPTGLPRVVFLLDRIKDAPVPPLVRMLGCAQREAVRGETDARIVVETFHALVADDRLPEDLHAALVANAVMLGEDSVMKLLEKEAANDREGSGGKTAHKRGSLAEEGETLGRRKQLARTSQGDVLLKILDDPHPDVIQNALLNPYVTESLAVRVAARRPVSAGVLEMVARSRFQNSSAVRRALVLNPDCPHKLASRLVATMTPVDLYDVVHAKGVSKELKATARRLLDSR